MNHLFHSRSLASFIIPQTEDIDGIHESKKDAHHDTTLKIPSKNQLQKQQSQHERRHKSTPNALSRLSTKLKLRAHKLKIKSKSFSRSNNSTLRRTKSLGDKISWRPSLAVIYNDPLLLNALVQFMENSYNSENILFLLSIKVLNIATTDIDSKIISIYNLYINSNAEQQINLSSSCFTEILSKRDTFITFGRSLKCTMFDVCVQEIERLIILSVLPSFYTSNIFHSVAKKSSLYCISNEDVKTQLFSPTSSEADQTPISLLFSDSLALDAASKIKPYKRRTPSLCNVSLHSFPSPVSLVSSNSASNSALLLINSDTEIAKDDDICATFNQMNQ